MLLSRRPKIRIQILLIQRPYTVKWFYLLILFSNLLYAQSWEDKSSTTPNLGLFLTVSKSCPFDYQTLKHTLDGEFLRARIKPTNNVDSNLSVYVKCVPISYGDIDPAGYAVHTDIRYGTRLHNGESVLLTEPNYGALLVGGTNGSSVLYFTNFIKEGVSTALTDYLAENIDAQISDSTGSSNFLLQLFAIKEKENAIAVKNDLNERGYNTSIINTPDYYRIVISGKAKESGDVLRVINELEEITGSRAQQIE